jgi:tricorn protease-like protein
MHRRNIISFLGFVFLAALPALGANGPFNGKIAFQSSRDGNAEIYVMNTDGTGQTRLTFNAAADALPDWSPDGTKIAFASNRDGNSEIYVMNADGSSQTRLTVNGAVDTRPKWSPNGAQILFESSRGGGSNPQIFVMDADGTNSVRLTNDSFTDFQADWSPDGSEIVFVSNRDGNLEIYVMSASGAGQTRLTVNTVVDQLPSFSPDGSKITFTSAVGNLNHVFVMNADGTSPTSLTASNDGNSAFSPNGRRIAFLSSRDGNDNEIYVMASDGSDEKRLTTSPGIDTAPAWQPVFPAQTIGVYRPSTNQWLLRDSNTAGPANLSVNFGQSGDLPLTGDWNGDGQTDLGVFRDGNFILGFVRSAVIHPCFGCNVLIHFVDPQPAIPFGQTGDIPFAGDWDGDGIDDLAVFRPGFPQGGTGAIIQRVPKVVIVHQCPNCPFIPLTIFTEVTHLFGNFGDFPVAGDWVQQGKDGVGVLSFVNGDFLLSNDGSKLNFEFPFANFRDLPMAANWTGVGNDSVGVFRSSSGQMLLSTVLGAPPDLVFNFGQSGDLPVAGHWEVVEP